MRRARVLAGGGEGEDGEGGDDQGRRLLEMEGGTGRSGGRGVPGSKKNLEAAAAAGGEASVNRVEVECARLLRRSGVDRGRREKWGVVIDWLQLYALLWSLSQPWPWPYKWLQLTRWTVVFNLDFMSLSSSGAAMGGTGTLHSLWGEHSGYLAYSSWFSFIPCFLGGMMILSYVVRESLGTEVFRRYGILKPLRDSMVPLEALSLQLADFMFLPIALEISRLFVCSGDNDPPHMTVDPAIMCWRSAWHVLGVLWNAGTAFACYILVFGRMFQLYSRLVVYRNPRDHERHVQLSEILEATGVDTSWRDSHAWLVSSYTRAGAHHRVGIMLLKLSLVIVYSSLHSNIRAQAVVYFMTLLLYAVRRLWVQPFRLTSSNRFHSGLLVTLCTLCFSGMLSGYGVNNGFLVASVQYAWLLAVTCAGWAYALVVLAITGRISNSASPEYWPSTSALICIMMDSAKIEWLALIREARDWIIKTRASPPILAPLHEGERLMGKLRLALLASKAADSLLELPLREYLQDTAALQEDLRPASLLPGPLGLLEQTLNNPATQEAMKHRRMTQLLFSPLKRRILIKLLAVSAFLDGISHPNRLPSLAVIERLIQISETALVSESTTLERINGLLRRWKRITTGFELEFENIHGSKPSEVEKMSRSEWYAIRGELESSSERLWVQRTAEIFSAPKAIDLHQRTKAALSGGKRDLASLTECKREWKKLLRQWEDDFQYYHGIKPQREDKALLSSSYRLYADLTESIKFLEMSKASW